mgnify:CR=1 FL=1
MKRERTTLSIISLVAMIVVMFSSVSVSAFEIRNGFVFFDAGEHVDFGLRCPEDRNDYVDAVQTNINDFFSSLGFIAPEKPELDASVSVFENIEVMGDYVKTLPLRFYARSHRVSTEGLTGFELFQSIANPELSYTFAIENQTRIEIAVPVHVFSDGAVSIDEMEAVSGVIKLNPSPYRQPSDPLSDAIDR